MKPIIIFDWRRDLLAPLADLIISREEDLARVIVVFPHDRPRRYLRRHLAADGRLPKPCRLPKVAAIREVVGEWRRELEPAPVKNLGVLDQVEMLFGILGELRGNYPGPLARLPLEREKFFPWGVRLAALLEDLFGQNREPASLLHVRGEVLEYAAALLEHLNTIYRYYTAQLDDRRWTTPGYDLFQAARRWGEIAPRLTDRHYYFAGFYALRGAAEVILRRLWEKGQATIVWHSDPALARGKPGHWACGLHREWLARWQATAACPTGTGDAGTIPRVRFYEGYDLHSQLTALAGELAAAPREGTAVVLTREDMLMPVLHHLPEKEVNITLGYPLARTTLAGLIGILMELQETRNPDGGYFWRPFLKLLRHPYVKMLGPEGGRPWRQILRLWELAIRQGQKYSDPYTWVPANDDLPEDAAPGTGRELLQRLREIALRRWEKTRTLTDLAAALEGVVNLLRLAGNELWARFPLDAEVLHRMLHQVVPTLQDNLMSRQEFEPQILFAILKEVIKGERVAFEAEPLTGLQVLGMLETRLLQFDRVIIINATEEVLPGQAAYDPLLPDGLRHVLGLTDSRGRDQVAAYNFYRLVQGAQEAVFLYHSGVEAAGDRFEKSMRSRFVEQLLWAEEQRQGRVAVAGEPPLIPIAFQIRSLTTNPRPLPRTPALQARLEEWLTSRPVSVSALDDYLRCPVNFVYTHVLRLRPLEEISEEAAPGAFGELMHAVLNEYFSRYRDQEIDYSSLPVDELVHLYLRRLTGAGFFKNLRFEVRRQLEKAGRAKLQAFLHTGVTTTIRELENYLTATVLVNDRRILVGGRVDRVDERPGGLYILDYKTGRIPPTHVRAWKDNPLWDRLSAASPALLADPEFFRELAQEWGSVQLPTYLFLHGQAAERLAANAGWVELNKGGAEVWFFPEKERWRPEERRRVITDYAPRAVSFLLRHMLAAGDFHPRKDRHCDWCPHRTACQG